MYFLCRAVLAPSKRLKAGIMHAPLSAPFVNHLPTLRQAKRYARAISVFWKDVRWTVPRGVSLLWTQFFFFRTLVFPLVFNTSATYFLYKSLTLPVSGELRMQKLKSHLVRTQSLNVLPVKPGVGQYIAIHATLTAWDFFLAYFYPSGPFTCIFSKPHQIFSFLCRPAE